jgi:hypothetical protein
MLPPRAAPAHGQAPVVVLGGPHQSFGPWAPADDPDGRRKSVGAIPLAPTRLTLVHFTTSTYCWAAVCPVTFVP